MGKKHDSKHFLQIGLIGLVLAAGALLFYRYVELNHLVPQTQQQAVNELLAVKHQLEQSQRALQQHARLLTPEHLSRIQLQQAKQLHLIAYVDNSRFKAVRIYKQSRALSGLQIADLIHTLSQSSPSTYGLTELNGELYLVSITPYKTGKLLVASPLPLNNLSYSQNFTLSVTLASQALANSLALDTPRFDQISSSFELPLLPSQQHQSPRYLKVTGYFQNPVRLSYRSDYLLTVTTFISVFVITSTALVVRFTRRYEAPIRQLHQQAEHYLQSGSNSAFYLPNEQSPVTPLAKTMTAIARKVDAMKLTLEAERNRFMDASYKDALTKLHNRRHLDETLDAPSYWSYEQQWVFILLDIDHFKHINDQYGHDMGDIVLTQMASLVKTMCRSEDICCRWGGEEFAIVCEGVSVRMAENLCERLRNQCELKTFGNRLYPLKITLSLGWVAFRTQGDEKLEQHWRDLFKVADLALYEAKNGGRNGWVGYHSNGEIAQTQPTNLEQLHTQVQAGQRQRSKHARLNAPLQSLS